MAAPHVGEFKIWLRGGGYRETTIEELVRLLACWTDWADAAGFTIDRVSAALDSFGAAFGESRNKREILNSAALFICRRLQSSAAVLAIRSRFLLTIDETERSAMLTLCDPVLAIIGSCSQLSARAQIICN
jgi:hypothetical protein